MMVSQYRAFVLFTSSGKMYEWTFISYEIKKLVSF